MATDNAGVRSLLKDVHLEGAAVIDKRKLLFLLGWGQDRQGAWQTLIGLWVEVAGQNNRHELYGFEVYDKIVLTMKPAGKGLEIDKVEDWAGI